MYKGNGSGDFFNGQIVLIGRGRQDGLIKKYNKLRTKRGRMEGFC